MLTPWRLFLCQMALNILYHIAKASLCLGGQDIFATVRENSPTGEFIANFSVNGDPGANSIRLCLTGESADWFYLEGRTIRLNSSLSRTLDREVLGSVLIAALACYEDETIRSRYRIMVEILNENDNMPHFLEDTIQPRYISELMAVNSMVFTVKAKDADGDTITYMTDKSSPDASYFRIDLPNSGIVILDKPLDFETKTQLQVVIYAVEMNTKEKYSTTATVTVNVLDGDDQYPLFLPCAPVYEDGDHTICTNPVYTVNITETDEDTVLYFSPGPIHAEDGDKDIQTPLAYCILSGDDNGRFTIDPETGEITLRQRVENRLLTPSFRLRIMVGQVNDPKKYSVATALVHVISENQFAPYFNKTIYKGFLIENASPATLVTTYRNQVLVVHAIDRDFRDGINPKVFYTLKPTMGTDKLYHITQDGIVIAKTDHLRAFDRHIMEVIAIDEESGETAHASVDIEVLQRGQPVPRSQFGEEQQFGDMNVGMAGGIAALVLIAAMTALFILLWLAKRRRERKDPEDRGSVPLGKHPNVHWTSADELQGYSRRPYMPFLRGQQVNSGCSIPLIEDASYHNEAYVGSESPSSNGLTGKNGLYTKRDEIPPPPTRACGSRVSDSPMPLQDMLPILVIPEITSINYSSSVLTYGKAAEKSVSFKNEEGQEILPRKEEGQILIRDSQMETREDPLMPVLRQATFITKAMVIENTAANSEKVSVDRICYPNPSVGSREKYIIQGDANYGDDSDDDGNPYKAMLSVIYSSDDDDTLDDEPNELRDYHKHGQNQFTMDQKKETVLEREDSTNKSFEQLKPNDEPIEQMNLKADSSTTGMLTFVDDSVEF